MSNPIEKIIRGVAVLLESMIEEAVKETQTPVISDEINSSLSKIKEERMSRCDHGLVFDEVEALNLIEAAPEDSNLDPAVSFIMGSPACGNIRKRYPRLNGPCPKGCGFNGIAYASSAHYQYGDW